MRNIKGNNSCNMKLGALRLELSELASEIGEDSEVWLSCDEEGNEFLPMSANPNLSVSFDDSANIVVLFPMHR